MDYFNLRGPQSDHLCARDLERPFTESPCPVTASHTRVRRTNDLRMEVKHSRHDELMIWSYGSYVVIHSQLADGLREAGLTGFRLRPASVGFRDGRLVKEYSELLVTGWAGVARPESGIKLIEHCPGCFRRNYSPLEDADNLIDWEQWNGEDFFIVWPLVKFILITKRAAEVLRTLNAKSYSLARLQPREGSTGFGVLQLSASMPEDVAIKHGRPLGLE
jgi:hypothetical protein